MNVKEEYRNLYEEIMDFCDILAYKGLDDIAAGLQDNIRYNHPHPDEVDEVEIVEPEVIDLTAESDGEEVPMTPPRQIVRSMSTRTPPGAPEKPSRVYL